MREWTEKHIRELVKSVRSDTGATYYYMSFPAKIDETTDASTGLVKATTNGGVCTLTTSSDALNIVFEGTLETTIPLIGSEPTSFNATYNRNIRVNNRPSPAVIEALIEPDWSTRYDYATGFEVMCNVGLSAEISSTALIIAGVSPQILYTDGVGVGVDLTEVPVRFSRE